MSVERSDQGSVRTGGYRAVLVDPRLLFHGIGIYVGVLRTRGMGREVGMGILRAGAKRRLRKGGS